MRAAEPELKAVLPFNCQRGTSIEITLSGNGLEKGGSVHFSREGLTAKHIEKNRFRVTADNAAATGPCDLWIATAEGLAGPRRFNVSSDPVAVEKEANDARRDAQKVAIPVVLEGRLDKAADLDWFTFEGREEQVIAITCRSWSLDGSVRPALTLFDPSGRELIHSASHAHDPQVTCRLPETGSYHVRMHDRSYAKDDYSFYQLEMTAAPADERIQRRDAVVGPDDLFAENKVVKAKKSSRKSPQMLALPCRVAGRFATRNEVDWFLFHAKKNQVIHIEAFGERRGQLMDMETTIYDSRGKLLTTASDLDAPKGIPANLALASLDPAVDWKVPADGEYLLAARDLYGGSVFGSDRVYDLILAEQQPAFHAIVMPSESTPGRGVFVKQGGSANLSVTVIRTGGFSGEVTIVAAESTDGVSFEPCILAGKEVTKPIKVTAAKNASTGLRNFRLVAEATIGSDKKTVPVLAAVLARPGLTRRIEAPVLYVSE